MSNKQIIDNLIKNLHSAVDTDDFKQVTNLILNLEFRLGTDDYEYVKSSLERALVISLQKKQDTLLFLLLKDYIDIPSCVTISLAEGYDIAEQFLIEHMVKNGMQTWECLGMWQAQLLYSKQLEAPRINTNSMAPYYIKYLRSISADTAVDDICQPALFYKNAIVTELINTGTMDTLEESIGITNATYNNGLSKFLHTYKLETKSMWWNTPKDNSIERIKNKMDSSQQKSKNNVELHG